MRSQERFGEKMREKVSIKGVVESLKTGSLSSEVLVERCLERILDPRGEGQRVFLKVEQEAALTAARFYDSLRALGLSVPPFGGVPIAIKDNFDLAGDVTTAGSKVLAHGVPAQADAPAVSRLRAAGFIPIGRTNMTEFAYSGLGLNPHYGTPRNPFSETGDRIPGGSSSGTAVAIADGMAVAGIGTDTGGSCRIPASFCGLVGFKPTSTRVPKDGVFPLSPSLDAVGPLGRSVECCMILDAIMSGDRTLTATPIQLRGMRIGVPQALVFDGISDEVADAFQHSIEILEQEGAVIADLSTPSLQDLESINRKGGFAAAESYAALRTLLLERSSEFDPRVQSRIARGEEQTAADYMDLVAERLAFETRFSRETGTVDFLAFPTTPMVAPTFQDLEDDEAYARANLLALRNPSVANMLDWPAISLPMPKDSMPAGFMLMGKRGADAQLFQLARSVETALEG